MIALLENQAIGIEVHYKLNILKETTKYFREDKKDYVLMVAYKSIAHVMNVPAHQIPSWDKLKSIKF